jgi:hypothetical protein
MKELTSPLRSAMLRQMERLFGSTQSKPNPKVSARRIRYYLHVSNGGQFLDETGEELSTREEAIARASVLAAELTKEGDWSGYTITPARPAVNIGKTYLVDETRLPAPSLRRQSRDRHHCAHPVEVVGGALCENSFFSRPENFPGEGRVRGPKPPRPRAHTG